MYKVTTIAALLFASWGLQYWQISETSRLGPGTKIQMHNQGTSLPATCTVGESYFKTDATAGQNIYGCTATNTWTLMGDGTGTSATIPTGTVAFFNLSACPVGWSEYTALRGRYPVGLVSSGTLEATSGTALSNLEARSVGQHNHTATDAGHAHTASQSSHSHTITISDPGHSHSYNFPTSTVFASGGAIAVKADSEAQSTTSNTTGITASSNTRTPAVTVDSGSASISVANSGSVAGTPAPYIQLLSCRKS